MVIETAPAFAIVDEPVNLRLRVEDLGAAPGEASFAPLSIALDGAEPLSFEVPVNRSVDLPVTLQRGGINVLQIATAEVAGRADRRATTPPSSRSTACATGCGCCWSPASPIRASAPGGTC